VFPLSNWTEMDVWQYIYLEQIPIPNLYYTHKREVFNRDGTWLAKASYAAERG
jgi:sulfate adenylyltransferase subunit 2